MSEPLTYTPIRYTFSSAKGPTGRWLSEENRKNAEAF